MQFRLSRIVVSCRLIAVCLMLAFEIRAHNANTNAGNLGRASHSRVATASNLASAAQVKQQSEQRYWLTIKSGIRHNSTCRYYRNSKGRACGPNEGRACKVCGG